MPRFALAFRYVTWLDRHRRAVIAIAAAVFAASAWLVATRLPVKADLSHLLPDSARSVRDLRALEQRMAVQDAVLVVVRSEDAGARAAAAKELAAAARALPASLVGEVEDDDADTRAFLRAHAHLFVPLDQLEQARTALAAAIDRAKLAADPLYISLDDDDDAKAREESKRQLDDLLAKRRDALAGLDRSGMVSADGTLQVVIVRAAFARTDAAKSEALMAGLARARTAALAAHAGVEVGFCSGAATTVAEHRGLVRGMVLSSLITALLVGVALWWFLRSLRLVTALGATLALGTLASFGTAAFTVGHLNAATAFLGAIIAGNGVNAGILLLGRYTDVRRRTGAREAMADAIASRLTPTLVASLGAAIAYGGLEATSFRGFADFAVIGGVGMVLCWLATFTVLPVLVTAYAASVVPASRSGRLGELAIRALRIRRPGLVVAGAAGLAVAGGVVAWRFVARDPFEYDSHKLQSNGREARELDRWRQATDRAFGRGFGGAGQVFVAVDAPADVAPVVAALRELDDGVPQARHVVGPIRSILDVMPADQAARVDTLHALSALLDEVPADELEPELAGAIDELRPPAGVAPITADALPPAIGDRLRERDGRLGLVIGVRPAPELDDWDGRELIRFTEKLREVRLPDGRPPVIAGGALVYADVLSTIRRDAPVVLAWVGGLLLLLVGGLVGLDRRALAVVASTVMGSIAMVAACAVLGLRVTFLDFVALPITFGLGVDYTINLVHDRRAAAGPDPALAALRGSGSAVFLCSLTTIIGYGSLLVSDNQAIRAFGTASLVGELCCLSTALVVAPAVLAVGRRRAAVHPAASSSATLRAVAA
ncbi:MAG TPA: MMPL family transporter [Kofleriaceae bacterium]|nr:MMPL family transporter [Kofleriaceae bacterium]